MKQTRDLEVVCAVDIQLYFQKTIRLTRGHAVSQWLRYCATNRTVADRFPMVSLEFFIVIVLPAALWPWG
jgi:hypothetical protein